ncbi:hypothetical protein [Fulvivirga ligni]|nr:hypothetical protein [Fulvivirga ligni]
MKKSLLILLVAGLFTSACASYSCPTYSKAPAKKEQRTEKTQHI